MDCTIQSKDPTDYKIIQKFYGSDNEVSHTSDNLNKIKQKLICEHLSTAPTVMGVKSSNVTGQIKLQRG